MGLINTRYRLILLGEGQALRIDSWDTMPRIEHDVPLSWETDVWYRMKFQVQLLGEEAHVRGKVWRRDEPEPGAWMTEFVDPHPNREGSPGVYGYSPGTTAKSKGTEVFYDNMRVTPND